MTNGLAIASAVAGLGSFVGAQTQAANQRFAANGAALNLEQQAKAERARSHMEAARRQRNDKALLSEQRTSMANSGFTPDATIIGETVAEQTLQQMLELAEAESGAKQLEYQAAQTRMQGRYDASATRMQGAVSLLGAVSSWGNLYGGTANPPPFTKPRSKSGSIPPSLKIRAA